MEARRFPVRVCLTTRPLGAVCAGSPNRHVDLSDSGYAGLELFNGTPDCPTIAPPNGSRRAEEPILKKSEKSLVAIVGVHIPMGVADTKVIHPLHVRFRHGSDINV